MPYRQVLVVWNTVSGPDTQEEDRKDVRRFLEDRGAGFEIRDGPRRRIFRVGWRRRKAGKWACWSPPAATVPRQPSPTA